MPTPGRKTTFALPGISRELTGYFQGIMGWLPASYPPVEAVSKHLVPVPMAGWYFLLTVLVLSLFWVATVRMACALAGRRIWDIMLVAASPLVLVHAFTNWDILAIFFRGRRVAAVCSRTHRVGERRHWLRHGDETLAAIFAGRDHRLSTAAA